jgi:hypothetical protein
MSEREYSYIELANAQFDTAIDLYLAGDYLPVITLAGAAEDLFGGPLRRDRDDPLLMGIVSMQRVRRSLHGELGLEFGQLVADRPRELARLGWRIGNCAERFKRQIV